MVKDYIRDLEKTWDSIAKSFDKTRRKTWQECIDFIDSTSKDSVIVDVGSGNGRHLIPSAKQCKHAIGIDISREMLKVIQEKINDEKISNTILIHSTAENIPIKDNSVDAVLYIATLHSIPGRENRIKSLKEIKRILKDDGKLIVSVWSKYQDKFRKDFLKKSLTDKKKTDFGDKYIYWTQDKLDVKRFYHLYSKKELVEDLEKAGFKILSVKGMKIRSEKYVDNYFAIATLKL
jgi:ubiquinone/menaquinone biosynthesis C-methylase UbiE